MSKLKAWYEEDWTKEQYEVLQKICELAKSVGLCVSRVKEDDADMEPGLSQHNIDSKVDFDPCSGLSIRKPRYYD